MTDKEKELYELIQKNREYKGNHPEKPLDKECLNICNNIQNELSNMFYLGQASILGMLKDHFKNNNVLDKVDFADILINTDETLKEYIKRLK